MSESRKIPIVFTVVILAITATVTATVFLAPLVREQYWIWQFESEKGRKREHAAWNLAKMKSKRAFPRLVAAYEKATPSTFLSGLWYGFDTEINYLSTIITFYEPEIVIAWLDARYENFGRLQVHYLTDILIYGTDELVLHASRAKTAEVRAEAARQLGYGAIKNKAQAVACLNRLLDDGNGRVRQAAAEALKVIHSEANNEKSEEEIRFEIRSP